MFLTSMLVLLFLSFRSAGSSSTVAPMDVDAKPHSYSFRYSLNFPSIGQCIIINNKNFDRSTGTLLFVLYSTLDYLIKDQTEKTKEHVPAGLLHMGRLEHTIHHTEPL